MDYPILEDIEAWTWLLVVFRIESVSLAPIGLSSPTHPLTYDPQFVLCEIHFSFYHIKRHTDISIVIGVTVFVRPFYCACRACC